MLLKQNLLESPVLLFLSIVRGARGWRWWQGRVARLPLLSRAVVMNKT